jgi:PAS domain S-box-containing protein
MKQTFSLTKAISVLVVIVASIIFINFSFDLPGLKSVLKFSQINFNTAVCFTLSGICLFLSDNDKHNKPRNAIIKIIAILILIIATITLIEHIFNINIGIDTLFYPVTDIASLNGAPARMDPLITILFIFLSVIFLFLQNRKFHLFIQVLIIIGLFIEGMVFVIVGAVIFDKHDYQFFSPFLHDSFVYILLFTGIYISRPLRYIHISFQKKIAAFFIVVIIMMSFLFLGISIVNKQTNTSAKRVDKSNKILVQNEQILNYSQSMEIGTRGFLISGNEVFVQAIDKYIPLLNESVKTLKALSSADSVEKKQADSLQKLVAENIATRKQLIQIRETKGVVAAREYFETAIVQQKMMSRLYDQISNVEKNEQQSLSTHKEEYEKSVHSLSRIIDVFYFILILLLIISFVIIYQNTRARNKAEEEIKNLNTTLEKRVDEKSEEIIEKEKQYRFLIENMREGIQVIGYDWKYHFVNNSLVKQSKYSSEQLLGKTMMEVYPGIENTEMFKMLEDCMKERKQHLMENEFIYPDGSKGWLELSIQPVPEGLFILSMDISERKKIEEEKNNLLDTVQKSVNEIITFSKDDLRIKYVNNGALKNLGYTLDEITQLTALDIKPDFTEESFRKLLKSLENEEQEKIVFITTHKRKDGTTYPAESHLQLIRQNDQETYLVIALDVSERMQSEAIRKQLNQNLEKRAAELQASNSELQRFAYVASHDLQEPLRMVSSFLQLLQKNLDGQLDEKSKSYIYYAVDGAERMKKLIHDLLEYSRVGSMELKMANVDCNEIMKVVESFYSLTLKETNARLKVDRLPVIQGVKPQILQLFQNLVGNAMKYHSDRPLEIEIGYEEEEQDFKFHIKDNGIGIDPKYFDKIFVVFQRLHNKSEYSGTGIGLSICKKIINYHGGRIWVESQPGEGATFYFTIPKKEI